MTLRSSRNRHRSSSTSRSLIVLSASDLADAARSPIDSSKLWASTGIITFSSKLPLAADHTTEASLPITCAMACITASHTTAFTLARPGMIDEPSCSGFSRISPIAPRGPEFEPADVIGDLEQ